MKRVYDEQERGIAKGVFGGVFSPVHFLSAPPSLHLIERNGTRFCVLVSVTAMGCVHSSCLCSCYLRPTMSSPAPCSYFFYYRSSQEMGFFFGFGGRGTLSGFSKHPPNRPQHYIFAQIHCQPERNTSQ